MTWQSPTDNKSLTKITVHGNAVDGNEQSSGDEILQEEAQEAESTMEILKKVPLKIYIG